MSHTRSRHSDDPAALPVVFGLVVGIVLCAVIIILLQAAFLWLQAREHERKVVSQPNLELEDLRFEEAQQQRTVGWEIRTGPESGTVRIPVDRALELFLEEQEAPR